ncbi:hypothetical protein Abr02nite_58530 [Paractinoplanes brasiliensis]|nr:hypothetical protein Abr02nite_58530 [Actinoplanes brasiliensis]
MISNGKIDVKACAARVIERSKIWTRASSPAMRGTAARSEDGTAMRAMRAMLGAVRGRRAIRGG